MPNPNSALAAVRLSDGDLLAAVNDLDQNRYQLSLIRSSDEGRTWTNIRNLESRDDQTYSYTSLIFVGPRAVIGHRHSTTPARTPLAAQASSSATFTLLGVHTNTRSAPPSGISDTSRYVGRPKTSAPSGFTG